MRVYLSMLAMVLVMLISVSPVRAGWVQDQYGGRHWVNDVQPNAYGHGLNMDTYGRPHQYRNQQGQTDSNWTIRRDSYGQGVHMNQYGQPVYDSQPGNGGVTW